ncbi:MAG: Histidine--tRNA ligase [Candidatus Anoxychlamydiales bacterium]|nr:Histidine--tRNA ligase [Candidatus Anoxychlamydiales bacterium]
MFQIPKGLFDIIPYPENEMWKVSYIWQYIEEVLKKITLDYNYLEIRTPIFEKTPLFLRGVGESSDIASKELYTFNDKANRSMSLRPEGTAPVMRAFIENKMAYDRKIHKLFYIGPMFRYDRPQKGRYRQHHQFGIECIGSNDHKYDAEVIDMLLELFNRLKIKNLKLLINSIGDLESRDNYKKALIDFLKPNFESLSKDSKERLSTNPLRILDSKDPKDKEIIKKAPIILDYLTKESKSRFENLLSTLDILKIKYEVDPKLVRGLDYYDDTVFEIIREDLGAQNSLGGGGRYNKLLKSLEGEDLPGIGFACGIERLIQTMLDQEIDIENKNVIFLHIIPLCEKGIDFSFLLAKELRHHKISVECEKEVRKIQKSLSLANKLKAKYALIIGDNEMNEKKALLKNLQTREQKEIPFDKLKLHLRDLYYKIKGK